MRPRQRDDWTERACLWVVVIGPPSTLKTPALKEGTRPIRFATALDHQAYLVELASWEEQCQAIRAEAKRGEKPSLPPAPVEVRRLTSDATIEKLADLMATSPGLTMFRDELTGWITSFNRYSKAEGDRQFFLECYSGGAYTVDRIARGTVRVPDVYLSIIGGARPDKARAIFGEGDDDGLAARFTAIYPETPSSFRDIDRWPDSETRSAVKAAAIRLAHTQWDGLLQHDEFDGGAAPFCRLDPEGGALWSQWHTRLMTRLRAGEWEGRHAGRVGKYAGLASRLALVSHMANWAAGEVRDDQLGVVPAETVARALDLIDGYLKAMDERVYRAFDRTQAANGGERIARWLLQMQSTSFTLRDIRRHEWSGLTDPQDVSAAVEWLAAMGWVREADPEQRPGRPANRFDVNPHVWEVRHDAA